MAHGWGGPQRDYGDQRPGSSRQGYSRSAAAASPRLLCTSQGCSTSASDTPDPSEFDRLRNDCLRKNILYEDYGFQRKDYLQRKPIRWMRPHAIARPKGLQPKFFVEDVERFDVNQGDLGDCYMLAALACLSDPGQRELFNRVVPPGQSFDAGWYAGIFHFNFWHMGRWEKVNVDDLLPTRGENLILNQSSQPNEFWAALLEKAYAKFYGSYEAIEEGRTADAFAAFTGGVTETYRLKGPGALDKQKIYKILLKALQRKSVVGCAIYKVKDPAEPIGLFGKHAYSLTDMKTVPMTNGGPAFLVRIRNPYGNGDEWTGAWSDRSRQWRYVSDSEKQTLRLNVRDDGEFWMSFQDFLTNFDSVEVCNVKPDCPEGVACKWHSFEFTESYKTKPQLLVKLSVTDKDDSESCSFLVQLMQSDRKSTGGRKESLDPIGFRIYEFTRNAQRIEVDSSGDHYTCQVVKRFALRRGTYCVVPYTEGADTNAAFYMRFFFEEGNSASLLK